MSVLPVRGDMWVGSLLLMIDRFVLLRICLSAVPLEFVLLQWKSMCFGMVVARLFRFMVKINSFGK